MADVSSWSRLGKLVTKHQKVQAIIDTDYMGTRYKFTGPPRGDDEQQAEQDLCYIRAAAEGAQDPYGHQANGGVHPVWLEQESI